MKKVISILATLFVLASTPAVGQWWYYEGKVVDSFTGEKSPDSIKVRNKNFMWWITVECKDDTPTVHIGGNRAEVFWNDTVGIYKFDDGSMYKSNGWEPDSNQMGAYMPPSEVPDFLASMGVSSEVTVRQIASNGQKPTYSYTTYGFSEAYEQLSCKLH